MFSSSFTSLIFCIYSFGDLNFSPLHLSNVCFVRGTIIIISKQIIAAIICNHYFPLITLWHVCWCKLARAAHQSCCQIPLIVRCWVPLIDSLRWVIIFFSGHILLASGCSWVFSMINQSFPWNLDKLDGLALLAVDLSRWNFTYTQNQPDPANRIIFEPMM